ncbi:transporter substrate-binding domain-containing protein [Pantoea dispersa]|uniref:transporter substrate-binding domain-containing protein n=1 Tax=Pantoea dispersa TaxID=59814 RepID=UPI0031FED601
MSDHPVLVHPKLTAGENFTYQPGMRLAIARWYVDDDWISSNFPGARIVHFDTDEEALASVAFKRNDFFIGNLVTTSYLLERNYPNHLEYQTVYPERDTGTRFIVSRNDKILLRTLNAALNAIPSAQSQIIMQQWSEEADIWRLRKHIDLNEQERKWIQRHPQVRVSVNSFYAPFTMTDAGDNFYGVTADILKLVSQRTGIEFIPVAARSLEVSTAVEL